MTVSKLDGVAEAGGSRSLVDIYSDSHRYTPDLFASSSSSVPSSLLSGPSRSTTTGSSLISPHEARRTAKIGSDYSHALQLPSALLAQQAQSGPSRAGGTEATWVKRKVEEAGTDDGENRQLALRTGGNEENGRNTLLSTALVRKKEAANRIAKPAHHENWKLSRVISGHLGWVRSIAVEPYNQWFATGAGDRMIKVWDLATGQLKVSLTGHISTVRGLAVSPRHPYLFSCGEDKMVKCWDLETNTVVRQYHGHLSGIYCLTLHPTLDVLITAGRDAVARVWDMRTKAQVHVLAGHKGTIASVISQESDPQVITGSMDATVRLWDLAAGKTMTTLTHHKKSVRALALHPQLFSFASGSSGGRNIKTWRCPEATLLNNATHDTIVNTLSVNPDGVLFSGGDDGSMKFFDYATGVPFQDSKDIPQPGSLDAEAGIFCSTFDQTGTRLLTGGADKTVKMYKEVS